MLDINLLMALKTAWCTFSLSAVVRIRVSKGAAGVSDYVFTSVSHLYQNSLKVKSPSTSMDLGWICLVKVCQEVASAF